MGGHGGGNNREELRVDDLFEALQVWMDWCESVLGGSRGVRGRGSGGSYWRGSGVLDLGGFWGRGGRECEMTVGGGHGGVRGRGWRMIGDENMVGEGKKGVLGGEPGLKESPLCRLIFDYGQL